MPQLQFCDARQWAEAEFGGAELGDLRRARRLVRVAGALAADPHGSLHGCLCDWGELVAAYRLLNSPDVSLDKITQPHRDQTLHACGAAGEYLLIEDTTTLDYSSHHALQGLGRIGNDGGRGLFLHSTLALRVVRWDPDQQPQTSAVGLLALNCWARTRPKSQETRHARWQRERESKRWAATFDTIGGPPVGAQWTYVSDREGDIYEVFEKCIQHGLDWLIRAREPRALADAGGSVFTAAGAAPVLGRYAFQIRSRTAQFKRPAQAARVAQVELRAATVTLRGPYRPGGKLPDLTLQVVVAQEVDPPADISEPIHWVLLTSWPMQSFEQALRAVKAYAERWKVEEYHKALKTGVNVEESQLANATALKTLIGMLAIVALRLLSMKLLAQAQGELPLQAGELGPEALAILQKKTGVPKSGWTYATIIVAIARLGGFLARKNDGLPGWITIWRGWHRLMAMRDGYLLATGDQRCV
jgi:hypothetical protein